MGAGVYEAGVQAAELFVENSLFSKGAAHESCRLPPGKIIVSIYLYL